MHTDDSNMELNQITVFIGSWNMGNPIHLISNFNSNNNIYRVNLTNFTSEVALSLLKSKLRAC